MLEILGEYHFTITKDGGYYIVSGITPKHLNGVIVTSGRSVEEVMDNMSDAYLTALGVKVGWWNKLIHKLKWYPRIRRNCKSPRF